MFRKSFSRLVVCLCLFSLLTLSACTSQPPSRFEQAQQQSIDAGSKNTAVEKEAVKGEKFNDIFPSSSNGYEVVFTQEKDGFVQAKLKSQGENLATLAIFDTISNPSARDDFANASDDVQGFPLVKKGSNGSSVLVSDRYQITIRSSNADFDEQQRKEWLEKFKLRQLADFK